MTQTITAAYDSLDKANNAIDELVSEGIPREMLFLDKETRQVKVIMPDTGKPEAEAILRRHAPHDLWSRPYPPPQEGPAS